MYSGNVVDFGFDMKKLIIKLLIDNVNVNNVVEIIFGVIVGNVI